MAKAYAEAGVNVEAGYDVVRKIKNMAAQTFDSNVLNGLGSFGGFYSIENARTMRKPVLVSGTDGVGTKLRLAMLLNKHDTIGIDCVAMCVNDIACHAAKPLFFLDYLAVGKLEPDKAAKIVSGVAEGCRQAGCALINTIFKAKVKDIMTGYRAFSHDFVKTFPILSKGFEIETEMTIHTLDKNLSLLEVPVSYRDRPAGSVSKLNTYSDGFKVLKTIMRLFKEYRPQLFFSILAFVFLAISVGFGTPVFVDYFKTGLVERFPTLIFSGFMLIISLLLWVCGIILEVIVKKHRQLFELVLVRTKKEQE